MDKDIVYDILLSVLSGRQDEALLKKLENLSGETWNSVLTESTKQRLTPLLYEQLSRMPAVPAKILDTAKRIYLQSVAVNLRYYHELEKVTGHFNNEGIPVILLKGAHLAEFVYEDSALRVFGDLDLLVMRKDLERAAALLEKIGYTTPKTLLIEDSCSLKQHLPLFANAEDVFIELHWTIANPGEVPAMDVEEIWQRAEEVSLGRSRALVLSREDLLLHICIHASIQHRFDLGIVPFCDIARILRQCGDTIDWERVRTRASGWNALRGVYLSLLLARDLVGAPVPDEVLNRYRPDGRDPAIVDWCVELAKSGWCDPLPMSSNIPKLLGPGTFYEKLRFMAGIFFPPRETMAGYYSVPSRSFLIYLFYPLRIKDVLARYSGTMLKIIRKEKEALHLCELKTKANAVSEWLEKP